MTGFENSNFWAGSTARLGDEETLPLEKMRHEMDQLATRHGPYALNWLHQATDSPESEWDARPLTQLCAEVLLPRQQEREAADHPLHQFAEEAALLELQVLLHHALEKLGFDTASIVSARHPAANQLTDLQKLPQTYRQALQIRDEAVVITTASRPHTICYANAAWEELCGFSSQYALDKTLAILQGPDTNRHMAAAMVQRCKQTRLPQHEYLVNYTQKREPFINHVCVGLLSGTSNGSEYMVGILQKVETVPGVAAS